MALNRQAIFSGAHLKFNIRDYKLWRAIVAEFVGTFLLVFIGCLSVLPSEADDNLDNLVVPGLCFAAIIFTLIHCIGPTSGCNINPVVTFALVLLGRCHWAKGLLYLPAQVLGGIAGALLLWGVSPPDWCDAGHMCMTRVNQDINCFQAVIIETVATGVLVLIVTVISDPDPMKDFEGFPSLAGAMAVLAAVYSAAPFTGASLNPARSFGPALVKMNFENHWVYWVGPTLGAFVAVFTYQLLLEPAIHHEDKSEDTELKLEPTAVFNIERKTPTEDNNMESTVDKPQEERSPVRQRAEA